MIYKNVFKNKKIIVTGHTGFKGSWLTLWLVKLGAKVTGISKNNFKEQELFRNYKNKNLSHLKLNIHNVKKLKKIIIRIKPDFVFHLAAQALVKISYEKPEDTYFSNSVGTLNLLESLRNLNKNCSVVLITSDKVYRNFEIKRGYSENDILGGDDPYSASKACAELIINSHIKSYFKNKKVKISVARAGNVIGGGDWSAFRLVPDCMKAWRKNKSISIRNPRSTRPWQHVLDALNGYLKLAFYLNKNKKFHGQCFNFGPNDKSSKTVIDLVREINKNWRNTKWKINKKSQKSKETNLLKLNSRKSKKLLNWQCVLSFSETIKIVVDWYKNHKDKKININDFSFKQIDEYEKKV